MKIEQLHDRRSLFDILDADEKPYLELHDQINKYHRGEYVWLEVSEIPWIVDTENMMLISEELLLSGIQYDTFDKKFPSLKYEKSNIKWYFNTYFKPEMLQFININLKDYGIETGEKEDTVHKSVTRVVTLDSIEKEKDNQENEKKQEIVKLLEEIRDNKKYYLGDDDINEIVKKKYNDYSRTISELKHKVGNENNGLHLNTNDPNFYYQRLLLDLNEIIEKLRVHSTKVKDCHEMIDILNECLKSSIDVNKDGICKLVKEANDIILGTNIDRTTKNELIRKLDDIINNNIKRINSYIDEYKKDINAKTKTINELKEEFENDFQPFRKQIEKVKSCRDMIDILNECQKEEIDISKDSVCETVNKIKTVIFKFLENEIIIDDLRRELDEILNNNINRVNSYIKEVFENKEDRKEKNLDELKEEFARELRPYLLKLQELVTKKDVVNEILIETKQIIQNTYKESSVTIAKNYLDELNKIMSIIRAKGTDKDVKKVEASLVNDYNITNSYEDIIAKLGNNIKIAYRIQLDIEENKQEKKEIEDVEVDIDIDSILDERNTK